MYVSHRLVRGWIGDRPNERFEVEEVVTGISEVNPAEEVPAGETVQMDLLWIPAVALKSLFITSKTPMTIKTNSPDKPDDVFEIEPTRPYLWSSSDGHPCPLSKDVDQLFVTNRGDKTAVLYVKALLEKPAPPETQSAVPISGPGDQPATRTTATLSPA